MATGTAGCGVGSQGLQDVDAVDVGQVEVQQDHGGCAGGGQFETEFAGAGVNHRPAGAQAQDCGEQVDVGVVVLDVQDRAVPNCRDLAGGVTVGVRRPGRVGERHGDREGAAASGC